MHHFPAINYFYLSYFIGKYLSTYYLILFITYTCLFTEFSRAVSYRRLRAVTAGHPQDFGRQRGAGRHWPSRQAPCLPQFVTDQGKAAGFLYIHMYKYCHYDPQKK